MPRWKNFAAAAFVIGGMMNMSSEALSQPLPFSIEVDNQGPAAFSNFRMAKSVVRGIPIDVLRFVVKIQQYGPQCKSIVIFRNVIAKSGAYIKKETWEGSIRGDLGEVHMTEIGDITIEWPQVSKVQI